VNRRSVRVVEAVSCAPYRAWFALSLCDIDRLRTLGVCAQTRNQRRDKCVTTDDYRPIPSAAHKRRSVLPPATLRELISEPRTV
jgi:hypothetical protein